MRRRLLTAGIAIAVVAVGVVIGLSVTLNQPAPSRTLIVQLTDPAGHPLTTIDGSVVVSISAGRTNAQPFERYAAASRTGCYNGKNCLSGWVGTVSDGVATFRNLPSNLVFVADADAGHAFSSLPRGELRIPARQTKSVSIVLTRGASITGRVTLPGTDRPAAGIAVGALDPAGHVAHRGITQADGTYRIIGLASGSYRVKFNLAKFGDLVGNGRYIWTFADHPITVHAQTKRAAASVVGGVDASLVVGHTLTIVNHADPAHPSYVAPVVYLHGGVGNSATVDLNSGIASGRLPAGSYYLMVLITPKDSDEDQSWWYAGDGKPVVRHRKDAVAVQFAGTTDETVTIG